MSQQFLEINYKPFNGEGKITYAKVTGKRTVQSGSTVVDIEFPIHPDRTSASTDILVTRPSGRRPTTRISQTGKETIHSVNKNEIPPQILEQFSKH